MSEQNNNGAADIQGSSQLVSTGQTIHPAFKGLMELSTVRQLGLMLGLALSVAIGMAVVLWSQTPSYDLLFSNIAEQDSAEIIDALDKLGVDYQVDTGSGAIMVPSGDVRELKLKLAAQGLPRSSSTGYELLDKETSFGTSKSVEKMRFQRALEGEIARTIMTIQNVKSARVLLALPKQSVFVRKQKKPSASVIVNLYRGRMLEKEQIEAIVHLVASSVPMLESTQVTVVDQKGRLLSSQDSSAEVYLTSKQFEYKKNIEEHLMERIRNILTPLVGSDGFRTQISADVDFTVTERTQEMFNPDLPALRSEQTLEEQNSLSAVQGVPGALSNQPPPAGVAPEVAGGAAPTAPAGTPSSSSPTSASKSATRNYELDKTITHTRLATGDLRRLSVAVVVDNKIIGEGENRARQPYSREDINQMTALVKQAVGFDNARGDQVTVTNVAFRAEDEPEPLPELPLWEQSWFNDAVKQAIAVAVVLFLVFGVLRPTLRGLVARQEDKALVEELAKVREEAEAMGGVVKFDERGKPVAVPVGPSGTPDQVALAGGAEDLLLLDAPQSYEKRLEYVRKLIDEDPKLVSQVLKEWLKDDG
ncbi:flagellar basal-body MS-ring/collar protein FliF [Methylomarinum vadi]|uniref:flagellar basal-body MS-ring/collar protein FliF n=1 Tax=Methylomarinum vadi TaxID=438855 RepID=UPI0004DEDB40|nr:flagellar basal-body MS-ring/collar protein FliF [Methylomarinum vadi]